MGWSIGWDEHWQRDIGYGVPAFCDHPECSAKIDRGVSYVCGGEPYGGEHGCGLYFCYTHLFGSGTNQRCNRCLHRMTTPYAPKPDTAEWMRHKLSDESWQRWRDEEPDEAKRLAELLATPSDDPDHQKEIRDAAV